MHQSCAPHFSQVMHKGFSPHPRAMSLPICTQRGLTEKAPMPSRSLDPATSKAYAFLCFFFSYQNLELLYVKVNRNGTYLEIQG